MVKLADWGFDGYSTDEPICYSGNAALYSVIFSLFSICNFLEVQILVGS